MTKMYICISEKLTKVQNTNPGWMKHQKSSILPFSKNVDFPDFSFVFWVYFLKKSWKSTFCHIRHGKILKFWPPDILNSLELIQKSRYRHFEILDQKGKLKSMLQINRSEDRTKDISKFCHGQNFENRSKYVKPRIYEIHKIWHIT